MLLVMEANSDLMGIILNKFNIFGYVMSMVNLGLCKKLGKTKNEKLLISNDV